MVIAGKEDFGNNLSNFGKKFLWSKVLTNLGRALLRSRPNDTIIYYYSNYDEPLPYHYYLPIYIHTPAAITYYCNVSICNIYIIIYICICVCMCYVMMCYVSHGVCVRYTVLSCSVQPACLCVGGLAWVSYCMYIRSYSINYSTTLIIIIIIIIIHTIQYIYYNYTQYQI